MKCYNLPLNISNQDGKEKMDLRNLITVLFRKLAPGLVVLLCCPGLSLSQTILSLEKATEIAMSNSPTIVHSQMNMEMSGESLKAQQAALKSQLSLSITPFSQSNDRSFNDLISNWNTSWSKSSTGTFKLIQPLKWTDGTLSVVNDFGWKKAYSEYSKTHQSGSFSNSVYFTFQQPIFTYNRTMMSLRQLVLNLEDAKLSYALQRLSLERQVATNFYNLFQSKSSLDIAIDELKNQEKSYEIIKNKVDAGLSAKEELYQAELNLSTSKSTVENRQVSIQNSYDTFKQLIGIPLEDSISVEANISFQPVVVDLQKAIDNALTARMELRQRNIDIENALNSLIQTSSQNEFKGNINLSYGLTGTDNALDNIFDQPAKKQAFGISFDVPLWDWGEKKARINASKINIESQKLSLSEDKTGIKIAIRQSHRSLTNLVTQIEIASQNVRNAELTYEINLERYKNGDLTSMDLNLYQTQLSQKKTSYTQALIDYRLALLNLKIISLWDFEKNEPVIPEQSIDFQILSDQK